MTGWNLPPGCTDADIDRAVQGDEPPHEPTREEQEADAWEYWHRRAAALETALHNLIELEHRRLTAGAANEPTLREIITALDAGREAIKRSPHTKGIGS